MADQERVTIKINVRADTSAIDRVQRKLAALCAQAEACEKTFNDLNDRFDALDKKNRDLNKSIKDNDDALRKHTKTTRDADKETNRYNKSNDRLTKRFGAGTKAARAFGNIMKVLKFAIKAAGIETLAYAAALSSVNLFLKSGQLLSRGYQASVRGIGVAAANAAAGVMTLAATFAAAMRQFSAAQNVGSYGGNFAAASRGLRAVQGDSQLAVFGVQALTGAFAAASKNARVTGQTVTGLRGLADFAATSGDMEKGLQAAAQVISLLQSGKAAGGAEMLNAAKELGPEFEKAYKTMVEGGKKSNNELISAIASGELARQAGIEGAAGQVSGTLIGQLKSFGTEIQVLFGDIGNNFLPQIQQAFEEIRRVILRTVVSITGNLQAFASGPFINAVTNGVDKLGLFTAKLFNEYLPKTEEVMTNFANGWRRFTGFFSTTTEKFSKFLNEFSEASSVINEFFGRILTAIGGGLSRGFENFADLVVQNKEQLMEFGDALGGLIDNIFGLFQAIREAFFKALPVINQIVDAISALVQGLTVVVSTLSGLGPLGAAAAVGLPLMGSAAAGKGRVGRNLRGGASGKVLGVAGAGLASFTAGSAIGYSATQAGMGTGGAVAGGALGGAAVGAALGSVIPGLGTAVGAIGGAIVGAIAGWFGSNKFKDEVREAAGQFADTYGEAIQTHLISNNYFDTAQQKVDEFAKVAEDVAAGLSESEIFTQEGAAKFLDVQEDLNKSIDLGRRRSQDLANIFGMTEKQIQDLARAADVDLTDNFLSLQEIMIETGLIVARFGDEFNAAISGAFGEGVSSVRRRQQLIESEAAINEVTKSFVDKVAAGNVTDADRLAVIEAAGIQAALMGGGDPLAALDYFQQNIGAGGIQLGAGGSLSGAAGEALLAGQGQDAILEVIGITEGAIREQIAQNIVAEAAALGVGVNMQAVLGRLSGMSGGQLLQAGASARNAGFLTSGIIPGSSKTPSEQVEEMLAAMGIRVETEILRTEQEQQALFYQDLQQLVGIEGEFGRAVSAFDDAVQGMIAGINAALGGGRGFSRNDLNTFSTNPDSPGYQPLRDLLDRGDQSVLSQMYFMPDGTVVMNDPYGNFNIPSEARPIDEFMQAEGLGRYGDTATSRFGRTMGVHNRLSSGIAGKRTITSGLRSFNLGSMSSDHASGYALDMIGNNLGAYQQAMKGIGGYAEFHGGTNNRHLHVVPPHGDTYSPANVASGMGGGGSTINVTVNAAPGMNEEAVAMAVARRLERQQQMMRERS